MLKSITVLTLLTGIVAADVAFAQNAAINLPVTVKRGESYEGLLERSFKLASKSIEQRLQGNKTANRVNLLVTAEQDGTIAPLFSVNVSRQDWTGNPNIQRWANVFPYGKDLLGFGSLRPVATPQTPPSTPPTEVPPPPANPNPNPLPIDGIPAESLPPTPSQRLQPNRSLDR